MGRKPAIPADQPELPGLGEFNAANSTVAGVDEVGRGALFGPVVAAAVILPKPALIDLSIAGIADSKQLSAAQRLQLATQIRTVALDYQIAWASVQEIDRLNILQASLLAMQRAVLRLKVQPELCLVDGNQRIPALPYPQQMIVKGDQRSIAIAAASILAKVWRDQLMIRLAVKYPAYHLASNKGYGTPSHRKALEQFGPSRFHRLSFSPCRSPGVSVVPVPAEQQTFWPTCLESEV